MYLVNKIFSLEDFVFAISAPYTSFRTHHYRTYFMFLFYWKTPFFDANMLSNVYREKQKKVLLPNFENLKANFNFFFSLSLCFHVLFIFYFLEQFHRILNPWKVLTHQVLKAQLPDVVKFLPLFLWSKLLQLWKRKRRDGKLMDELLINHLEISWRSPSLPVNIQLIIIRATSGPYISM